LDPGPANEAIHEHLPGGAAARAKLANSIIGGLSAQFYFSIGEIVEKAGSGPSSLKLTGYEFREATKGSALGPLGYSNTWDEAHRHRQLRRNRRI
jgi:hypothetical protein